MALHPDISLEPSAFFRFTQKILLIDTDIKDHIVAGKSHKIQFFIRIFIDCLFHIFDFTHDLVLVTFHAIGHHKRIDHREKILFLDSLGNHGIRIHILNVNYRMHDKYLITDEQMYLLGGRNSNDIFLGDRKTGINEDREIFVYETKTGEEASFLELEEYFSSIWEENCVKAKKFSLKAEKKEMAEAKLLERYKEICEKYPELSQAADTDWTEETYPVESITLIHNGTRAEKHEPMMLFAMEKLLENGKDIFIQTPYVIADKAMYEVMEKAASHADTRIILNAVEKGSNPWGCTDYLNNKKKILGTGCSVYELMNEAAVHTKTIVVDDRLSIVGSYNWDMRSTYLDTELMLVIDSQELNQHLRQMNEGYMEKSREVLPDGTETEGKAFQEVEMTGTKKGIYGALRVIIRPFRHLL